ncbi:MAG: hypothetical protein LBL19_07935 [Spirochaetaceae bacterium]|jgi:hypothetical protein|nr:hypothetical protein [Spirochaetaceae bacterium]
MSRKRFSVGTTVLLAVVFIFMACDTGTSPNTKAPEEPLPVIPPLSFEERQARAKARELASALEEADINVTVSGTTVTLNENGNIDDEVSLEVPSGVTFVVPNDKTLTVADGGSYGGEGTIKIETGGTLVDQKVRTSSTSYAFGALGGKVEIAAGGKFQVNASTTGDEQIRTLVGPADDENKDDFFLKTGTNGTVTLEAGEAGATITISGNVELGSPTYDGQSRTLLLYEDETLVIPQNAVLTVKTNAAGGLNTDEGTVVVHGTLIIESGHLEARNIFAGASTGTITVQPGGSIIQVGEKNSGSHLIRTNDWTTPTEWTEKTVYQWESDPSDAEFVIDFTAKTITFTDEAVTESSGGDELTLNELLGDGWEVEGTPAS